MPGVYLEYIKAGKFVVPVELTFQTEQVQVQDDIRGLVTTSKWIEKHNWKEIKAMLKPAVEACLKYNETPLENIPKSHHISYGENVSLGYLIVANKLSTPFLSVLDTKKNCWTDDEDDDDELLGIDKETSMEDHGGEYTEFMPTKTAIRVCVVRKSVVSIDDARRIRKELGVRSEEIRNYFPSTSHLPNEPGPSSLALNQYSENNAQDNQPSNRPGNVGNDRSSDSETENIPRTFGDPDEIRDAARIYTHVINRDIDSGEDPDDDLSLPDIEPNPPKKKKGPRSRKKSTSFSPSKSKRLTHSNILSVSQEGQANFSEEDTSYKRTKRPKRKRTVAVVEPMRTLPNGQLSFEQSIGALGSEKRRKARPGTSHGLDKTHSGGGRSKQPPAIDIIAPDDDRLTITNPPEPIPVATPSTSNPSPLKEQSKEPEKRKKKKKKRVNRDADDPHRWERLTPSPLFDDDDQRESSEGGHITTDIESDLEMPTLVKMVDSDEEAQVTEKSTEVAENEAKEDETPALVRQTNTNSSLDMTQVKTKAALKRMPSAEPTFPAKPSTSSTPNNTSRKESDEVSKSTSHPENLAPLRRGSSLKKEEVKSRRNSSPEIKIRNPTGLGSSQHKVISKSCATTTTVLPSPPIRSQNPIVDMMGIAKQCIMNRTSSPEQFNKALKRSGSPQQADKIKKRSGSPDNSAKTKKTAVTSEPPKKTIARPDVSLIAKKITGSLETRDKVKTPIGTENAGKIGTPTETEIDDKTKKSSATENPDRNKKSIGADSDKQIVKTPENHTKMKKPVTLPNIHNKIKKTPLPAENQARNDNAIIVPAGSHDKNVKAIMPADNPGKVSKSAGSPEVLDVVKNSAKSSPLLLKGKTPDRTGKVKKPVSATASDTVTKPSDIPQQSKSITKKKKKKKKLKKITTVALRNSSTLALVEAQQQEKPKMGDAQTQTDDLLIVPQITKRAFSPMAIGNKILKMSKSCDASSEEELFESPSPRSRTPVSALEISRLSTSTPIHHPALGSPDRDFVDDDGLFSFESPTIPVLSTSQTTSSLTEDASLIRNTSSSVECPSTEEIFKSTDSPQPGCSHWGSTPTRPMSPPRITLMPPPASRPPRTPRKNIFNERADNDNLTACSQELLGSTMYDMEDIDDTMPIGSEASNVTQPVGQFFNLMNQPHVFQAGIGLIEKLTSSSVPANLIEKKLGLGESQQNEIDHSKALVPVGSNTRKRDLSPDICELVPDKRLKQVVASARRSRKDSFEDTESLKNAGTDPEDSPQTVALRQGNDDDDEASDVEKSGEDVLLDYINKSRANATNMYEPRGDEFDLSQRSICLLNVVPHYDVKSRLYKIHSKAVRETEVPQLCEHFRAIVPDLIGIFQGKVKSVRHLIFLRGFEGRKDLRSLMVALPFTTSQGETIVHLIRDTINGQKSAPSRTDYLDYINCVLVPEALIRIYARISQIPFENADTEMRHGAVYDGELSDTIALPARE